MPIKLTVSQPAPVALSYVEAAIKPEVVGHITPTYEEQTVYPAAGTTFGRVDVDAIPDPTAVKEIDSNGDHDVRRYGVARVSVTPTLQSKTATPTEQAQTVLPDTGYDGLESVNIARIPTEYIVPTGTKNISQNGTESVREYDSVNVSVVPTLQDKTIVPTKQTQTVNADSGFDGLGTVQVDPIPSEYIVPQGKVTINQNGTVNVSQYAEAEVSVSSTPQPVLLDSVNFDTLSEQVNRVTFDITQYDLTNKHLIWVQIPTATLTTSDWVYFNDSVVTTYLNGSRKTHSNVFIALFAKPDSNWRSVLYDGSQWGRYPAEGNTIRLSSISLYCYSANTKFESGGIELYAI